MTDTNTISQHEFTVGAARLKLGVVGWLNDSFGFLKCQKLVDAIREHCILTGGVTASVFHGENINDYDLYARTKTGHDIVLDSIQRYHPGNIEVALNYATIQTEDGKLVSANAITLHNQMQFITMGTFHECRASFDFKHCLPYYDIRDEKFYISPDQYQLIKKKELYPITGKLARLPKFEERGWKLTDANLVHFTNSLLNTKR